MNMKQYKYVLVIAQEGTFSKAAEKLNISQPSLSQYIKNIEKQVGVDLFVRANGEVRLTDAGEAYLDAGRKILSIEHEMENKLTDISNFKDGKIIIGISPYRSVKMIPEVLREFNKVYPDIKLVIKEKSGNDLINSEINGELDLCIIALPIDEKYLNYKEIQKEEIVIAVNKNTELYKMLNSKSKETKGKKYPAVDIKLIEGQDFAVLNEFMSMSKITNKLLEEYNVKINTKIEVSSIEGLYSIVNSGVCASILPSGGIDENNSNIRYFSISQKSESRIIVAAWRKDQYLSKPVKDLIEIFKKI